VIAGLKAWLNANPRVKGGLVAAESVVGGALATAGTNWMNGKEQFTSDSLRKFAGTVVVMGGLAFWNYLKTSPSDAVARNDSDALKAASAKSE